ncbi:MAG: MarC family protein [Chloroflexi bacterium]|nr:MarC family protein [Chloroflexota bacterium]
MELGALDILMVLLVTIGPLKAVIVYTTLTADADPGFRRSVAIKTVVTATVVGILFVVAGEFLLKVFHISIPALKIAGGLILVLYALSMVMGGESNHDDHAHTAQSTDIGIYPLAMPLMATPQGIVAIVTITATATSINETLLVAGLVLGVMAFNFVVLLGAHRIMSLMGPSAIQIVARIVGLLLVALAVQLMIWGFEDLGVLEPMPG